jgi:uncharacterized membrane protein
MKRRTALTGMAAIPLAAYIKPEVTQIQAAALIVSPVSTHPPQITRGIPHATATSTGTSTATATSGATGTATPTGTATATGTPNSISTATPRSTHTSSAGGSTGSGASSNSNSKSVSSARSSSGEVHIVGEVHAEVESGRGGTYEPSETVYPTEHEAIIGSHTPQEGYTATLRPVTSSYSPIAPNAPVRDAQKPSQLPNAGEGAGISGFVAAGLVMVAAPVVEYLRRRKNGKT